METENHSPTTYQEWEVSVLNGNWEKTVRASEPPAILAGYPLCGRERVGDSLRRCWASGVLILLIAAVGTVGFERIDRRKRNQTAETRRNAEERREKARIARIGTDLRGDPAPMWTLLAISFVWVVLFVNN